MVKYVSAPARTTQIMTSIRRKQICPCAKGSVSSECKICPPLDSDTMMKGAGMMRRFIRWTGCDPFSFSNYTNPSHSNFNAHYLKRESHSKRTKSSRWTARLPENPGLPMHIPYQVPLQIPKASETAGGPRAPITSSVHSQIQLFQHFVTYVFGGFTGSTPQQEICSRQGEHPTAHRSSVPIRGYQRPPRIPMVNTGNRLCSIPQPCRRSTLSRTELLHWPSHIHIRSPYSCVHSSHLSPYIPRQLTQCPGPEHCWGGLVAISRWPT